MGHLKWPSVQPSLNYPSSASAMGSPIHPVVSEMIMPNTAQMRRDRQGLLLCREGTSYCHQRPPIAPRRQQGLPPKQVPDDRWLPLVLNLVQS